MRFILAIVFLAFINGVHCQPGYDIQVGKRNTNIQGPPFKKPFASTTGFPAQSLEWSNRFSYLHDFPVRFDTIVSYPGDTIGCHYKGSYLWYRSPSLLQPKPLYIYLSEPVTNEEYRLFRQYVIDSLKRHMMAVNGAKYGIILHYKNGDHPSEDEFSLDWSIDIPKLIRKNLMVSSSESREFFMSLYYPTHERLTPTEYKIDERRLRFRYIWQFDSLYLKKLGKWDEWIETNWSYTDDASEPVHVPEVISILRDSASWFNLDLPENISVFLTEHYGSSAYFDSYPVTGLTGRQAEAFCAWKEKAINTYLRQQGISLLAYVTLPTLDEANLKPVRTQISVPSVSPDWWRISNEDYKTFMEWAQDSIFRTYLAFNGYPKFIKGLYADADPNLNVLDRNERLKSGRNDPLFEEKLLPAFVRERDSFWSGGFMDPAMLVYTYRTFDHEQSNRTGLFKLVKNDPEDYYKYSWEMQPNTYGDPSGKDLELNWTNRLLMQNMVRSHEDRSRFIYSHSVAIYPGYHWVNETIPGRGPALSADENTMPRVYDFESCKTCSVNSITWQQALAYFHWYIHIRKPDKKAILGDPEQYLLPTEEQWVRAMKGETGPLQTLETALPYPLVRYVIRLYPTN